MTNLNSKLNLNGKIKQKEEIKMGRLCAVLSLMLVLALLQTACAPPAPPTPTPTPAPIELTILTNWTPDVARGKALKSIVDRYNEQRAGRIRIKLDTEPDWPELQAKIRAMIAAGRPPDIFHYNFNPNDLSREKSGQLMNFAPYMDEEWRLRFRPDGLKALTFDGELLALPIEQTPILFYYNKALFEKAGVKSFPETWEEFFQVCEALKNAGIAPISLMTVDDAWHTSNVLTYIAASIAGPDVFAVGQPLDSPAVVKAAELVKQLFEKYTTPDAVGANWAVSSGHFLAGRTAMIIDGPWLISLINDQVEDPTQIGVAVAPTYKGGKGQPGLIVTDAMTPWAAGKQPTKEREEAIVDFMKYFTSEESVKIITLEGNLPLAVKATFTEEELKAADPLLAQVIVIGSKAPEAVVSMTRILKPPASEKLPALLEGLALGQISPEEFAKKLQEFNK